MRKLPAKKRIKMPKEKKVKIKKTKTKKTKKNRTRSAQTEFRFNLNKIDGNIMNPLARKV